MLGQNEGDQALDLLVIGAGIYGIQAARTYLTIHPTHQVLVLEASNNLGGVWSKNRVYPHFFTQSPLDIWTFSDKALKLPKDEETFYDYFPAGHFKAYLSDYVTEHLFNGMSLRDRIVCGSAVRRLEMDGVQWKATTASGIVHQARKVIDATGLTSQPNIPIIAGSESFAGLQRHSKDFAQHASTIFKLQSRVVIVGGGKSAADIAYSCAKSGFKDIHWVIRKSGSGPAAYLPPDPPVPKYTNSNSAFHTSFIATITACIFTPQSWWTWFLYQTFLGRALHALIWMGLQSQVYGAAKYDRKDEAAKKNGFVNLKPDGPLFWMLNSAGVNQRPDFFDLIAQKVKVYRQDIDSISASQIHLQNGEAIDADVIFYATGWDSTPSYIDAKTAYTLGLRTPDSSTNAETEAHWTSLLQAADIQVLKSFPCLSNPPKAPTKNGQATPFRLYRSLFPTTTHLFPHSIPTIAFLGRTNLANGTYASEVQALYAVAVLEGVLKLPSEEEMEREVAHVNAWMKRRYPGKGESGDFLFFDVVPYTDRLLGELGLARICAKRGLFGGMSAKDLKGMLDEVKGKWEGRAK